ncbi:4'-phosphopantetheinyl transferase family protein [Kribbella sp. NPDC054772]
MTNRAGDGAAPEVEVWWAEVGLARQDFIADLNDVERGRLDAYLRDVDKARFLLGVTIVRRVLAARLSLPAAKIELDRTCPECAKPHGKVRTPGAELSVTHSGDLVGVAFAEQPVGLDVEQIDSTIDVDAVARIALAPAEAQELNGYDGIAKARAFTTYWTRKEAVLKATGEGLRGDLRAAVPPGMHVIDLEVGADHRAALAIISRAQPTIRTPSITELLA